MTKLITAQEKFWTSSFGKNYIKRNYFTNKELDDLYLKKFNLTRSALNKEFLGKLKINIILEVGCNVGNQLALLQSQGFKNLYGVEIFGLAVELAKKRTKNINIVQGSAFDLPFKDNCFDLVFTSGVFIHINPKDTERAMREIYRTSKKYIWGYEYYSPEQRSIDYRNNKDRLWSADFAKIYTGLFPDLKLKKEKRLAFKEIGLKKGLGKAPSTTDLFATMFLLEKKK